MNQLQTVYENSFEQTIDINVFIHNLQPFILQSTFEDYEMFKWIFVQLFENIKTYEKLIIVLKFLFDAENRHTLIKANEDLSQISDMTEYQNNEQVNIAAIGDNSTGTSLNSTFYSLDTQNIEYAKKPL